MAIASTVKIKGGKLVMTHLHIPDGVIPGLWLLVGFILSGVLLAYSLYKNRGEAGNRLLPRIGVTAAVMLLAMSVPLGLLPIHLNLAVLGGILLGPWLAFITVFLVNFLFALVGHGGITVLGWNTFFLGVEAMVGGWLFQLFVKRLKVVTAAAGATVLAMTFSLLLLVGTIRMIQIEPDLLLHHHGDTGQGYGGIHREVGLQEQEYIQGPSLCPFVTLALPLGLLGVGLETFSTSLAVGFLLRARPDLLTGR